MIECVEISIENEVEIGAHPSYPDKESFGRKKIDISRSDLYYSLIDQIETLNSIAVSYGKKFITLKLMELFIMKCLVIRIYLTFI